MAGCFDSSWRVGSKARGTRSPFKLPIEGLLPFKCTYPVHLTDMMDQVPSTQSDLRRGENLSPFRETRTRTVREYEETIEQLRKENFDLKLRRFLLEEALQKYLQKNEPNSVEVAIELQVETEALKRELNDKEQLLQASLSHIEKYRSEYNELQNKFEESQKQIRSPAEIPLEKAWVQLKDEKEQFEKEAEHLEDVLNEKDKIILNANAQIEELSKQIETLEAKAHKKSLAIQGIVHKYYKDIEMIPKELRPIVQEAVQAAKECKEEELNAAIGQFKASLSKIMPTPVQEVSISQQQKENRNPSKTKTSVTGLQKIPEASQSLREFNQSSTHTDSQTKFVHVMSDLSPTKVKTLSQSTESINESVKSLDSAESENFEKMINVLKDNENLKNDNEEKARTINDLNSTCSELERRTIQLQSELSDAVSKVKKLEMKIREEKSKSASSLPKKSLSVQTAVQCHLMESKLSDSFLQSVGQSDSVDELKEEILRLLLIIEQKDKELSDNEQELGSLQSHLEKIEDAQKNNTFSNVDKEIDDFVERNDLHERLAISCQVNHELMDHLRKLETFMEDLLQHKNLDSSSIENISEALDLFSRLTTCLDETKKLSSELSGHLSVFETSKLLDQSDISLRRESRKYSYPEDQSRLSLNTSNAHSTSQGRNNLFQSESSKPTAGTGKRRLSFSTLHNATRLDSDKVVVLGTSNNEDLILLLNEQGDPEDVLIRNNHSQLDRNPSEFDLPRHYLDSSLGFGNQDGPTPMDRWCASEMLSSKVVQNRCLSSDSDIWSEPDRDVSLQRIGIDVQKSPVTQKSPRRLRLRDKRTTDELTSQKNESSSSAVKFHPLSKRRKSSETLKSPSVCRKCQFQSPSKHESAEKVQLQKVVSDLSNKCNNQENQLQEMRETLDSRRKEIDTLKEEKLKLTNSVTTLEKELTELKIKDRELTLQSSESTGKLMEVSDANVKLRKSIELLDTKATESDSVCKKLKEELEETKLRLQNLDEKCSKYEVDLSSSSATLKDYNEKYNNVVNEKNELLNNIQELVLTKDELLQAIQIEKDKIQRLEKENGELKRKLEEKSQSVTSLQSQYAELENKSSELLRAKENELLSSNSSCDELKEQLKKSQESVVSEKDKLSNKIQELDSTKNELLQSIQSEKNKIQTFENENTELKEKLQEKSQSLVSLQTQYAELENKSSELLRENKSDELKEQLKKSKESFENYEEDVRKSLLQVKNSFLDNLQNLSDVCKQYFKCDDKKYEDIDNYLSERLSTFEKDDKIKELFTDINTVSTKFEQIIEFLSDQLSSVSSMQQKLEVNNREIQSLEKQNSQLNAHVKNLQLTESESKSLIKESKSQVELLQKGLNNAQEEIKALEYYLSEKQSYVEDIQTSLKDREKSLEQSKVMLSSSEMKLNSLQKKVEEKQNLLDQKDKQISELENRVLKSGIQLNEALLNKSLIQSLEKQNSQLNAHVKNLQLTESESKSLIKESKSQVELLQKGLNNAQEEIKALEYYLSEKQSYVEDIQTSLKDREKSLEQSKVVLSSSEMKLNSLQKKVEEKQNLLDQKDKQISELENRVLKSGIQLNEALLNKMTVASQLKLNPSHLATGTVSALDPSKGSPNVSVASETSIRREASDVRGSHEGSITSISSIASANDQESIKNVDKYNKKIKTLKTKLVMSETRIEILEKEKSNLREELLAQVQGSQSSEEVDSLRKNLADLKERLEAKTSFIKDLKSDMFKTCNSLVDKQKEVDDLRHKLSDSKEQCTELKLRSKEESLKFRFSEPLHSDTEANIKILKRQKWDLIQSILNQQKQFYERKNIHLGHLEKFKTRIEKLQATQISPTMFKSDSEPFLSSFTAENNCYAEKLDKTLKNLQMQLELDTECLQNVNIFLKRFFIPILLQSCEYCSKSIDSSPKHSSNEIGKSAASPSKILHDSTSDRESLSEEIINLSRSGSISPMSFEGNLPFQSVKSKSEASKMPASQQNRPPGEDNFSELSHKSSNIIGGSQESIFLRSHYSSPDLGIESDPNHESSAPEQKQEPREIVSRLSRRHESGTQGIGWSAEKQAPESAQNLIGSSTKLQDHGPFSGGDTLHAICMLQHYELLKKEVEESLVGIKSVITRTNDGLQRIGKFTSPRKNLEYTTFKAIKDTSGNIEVCMEEARKLVEKFWIAPCPSVQELNMLIQQNREQQEKLRTLRESKMKQERYYDEALARLKQAEIKKEKMEKKISKRLVNTKKVIRQAEIKLLERGSQDTSRLPKYPMDEPTCQKKL